MLSNMRTLQDRDKNIDLEDEDKLIPPEVYKIDNPIIEF